MQIKALDLEIFVLSYNRATLIGDTLKSIAQQTLKGFRTTVLDNGSNAATLAAIEGVRTSDVLVDKIPTNIGARGIFQRAQALAERDWVIVCHDDDIFHPNYIETVINVINKNNADGRLTLVASCMSVVSNPKLEGWPNNEGKLVSYEAGREFVTDVYGRHAIHFGSVVYKRSVFQKIPQHEDLYGKGWDHPFIFENVMAGRSVILTEPWTKYRIHAGQGGKDAVSGPFLPELAALHRLYREILTEKKFSRSHFVYLRRNFTHLYQLLSATGFSMREHWLYLIETRAMTYMSLLCGLAIYLLNKLRPTRRI